MSDINEADIKAWLRQPYWEVYASHCLSGINRKQFALLRNGIGFRVTLDNEQIYEGQDLGKAVEIYNSIRNK